MAEKNCLHRNPIFKYTGDNLDHQDGAGGVEHFISTRELLMTYLKKYIIVAYSSAYAGIGNWCNISYLVVALELEEA